MMIIAGMTAQEKTNQLIGDAHGHKICVDYKCVVVYLINDHTFI